MKRLYCLCLCCLIYGLKITLAQPGIADLNMQRANVILIHAARPDNATEIAAGFYVGQDEFNAYFVTPLHALRDKRTGQWAKDVMVQLWGSGTSHRAMIFDHFNEQEDLAVLLLPLRDLGGKFVPMEQKEPTAELNIHLIGHPASGTWIPWTGTVQNEYDPEDPNRFTTNLDLSLQHGYSGSPILDSHGNLIGMHLAAANSSINLSSRYIVTFLLAWHLPTSNLRSSLVPVAIASPRPGEPVNGGSPAEPSRHSFRLPPAETVSILNPYTKGPNSSELISIGLFACAKGSQNITCYFTVTRKTGGSIDIPANYFGVKQLVDNFQQVHSPVEAYLIDGRGQKRPSINLGNNESCWLVIDFSESRPDIRHARIVVGWYGLNLEANVQ